MGYFANMGPQTGPILERHGLAGIGVLGARDRPTPIGMAVSVGWGEGQVALWELTVADVELPGLWVVVDRRFHSAYEDGRGSDDRGRDHVQTGRGW